MDHELTDLHTDYGYFMVIDKFDILRGYRCAYCVRMFGIISAVKRHMAWHRPKMDGCGGNPAKSDRLKWVKRPVLIV